jgi:hypothetical protein
VFDLEVDREIADWEDKPGIAAKRRKKRKRITENNCLGHCFLSLKRHALVPGTLSGAVLVLPYSVIAIFLMRTDFRDSFLGLFGYAAIGAIATPVAIAAFLWLGYLLAGLRRE